MPLEITFRDGEKVFIHLKDGKEVEMTMIKKENGNRVMSFEFPSSVGVWREAVHRRIREEEKMQGK